MKTKNNNLNISKAGKVMMFVALISALVMYFNVYLDAIGYFFSIQFGNWLAGNAHQDMTWEAIPQFQSVMNWILVLILTVLSVIFLIKDKKGQKDIRVYEWYIRAGVLHILIGILGLDGIVGLPSIISLNFSLFKLK